MLRARAVESGFDRSRMVGKIVINSDAVYLPHQFHTAFDTHKTGQRFAGDFRLHTYVARRRYGGSGIVEIVDTRKSPPHFADGFSVKCHRKPAGVFLLKAIGPIATEGLHRRPAAFLQNLLQGFICLRINNQTVTGDGTNQMVKLGLNRSEIGKYIGVIEFEVIHDQRARPVVDKFRALVKKCAVVFIRFDYKKV